MKDKLSIAANVLIRGGYFRKALERTYHGSEQFKIRLRDHRGQVVRGIGSATFYKLETQLRRRECLPSSTWPEEWEWADRETVEINRSQAA